MRRAGLALDESVFRSVIGAADLGLREYARHGGAALSGSIRNFQYFDQAPVSGSVSISGGTIASNEVLGASATGTVAGRTLDYDVDGEFQGASAQVLYLWFDGTSFSSETGLVNEGGVGIGLSD